jgi:pyruvate-formate lyase-activating enzyme
MRCRLLDQEMNIGKCQTTTGTGDLKKACEVTLERRNGEYRRLIKSIHLSRPEDYLSIYQSGCNHDCLKCHSAEFSKTVNGNWFSNDSIAKLAEEYSSYVTVSEPRSRATMWHADDLCLHCGSCILSGKPSSQCPKKLKSSQVVLSPQGFGPARNIVAFTGGDLTCNPDYYASVSEKIKEATNGKLWVLVETNGYALTRQNLEVLKAGQVDSYWLDIKAYDDKVYKKLCGTSNTTVLQSVEHIVDLGFTLEILTLFIPGYVETDQHMQIARLIADIDPELPTSLLAFFPTYKLNDIRAPTFEEMIASHSAMKEAGVKNLRLGNLGVFAKTPEEQLRIYELQKEEG